MSCRLCLRALEPENAVSLFETNQKEAKLIAKYFLLEITQDDAISTHLCEDCSDHLEEFHKFWIFVDLKQSSLGSEFLAVKCSEIKEDARVVIDVSRENADNQEEILLDIKYIPAPETYDGSIDLAPSSENLNVIPDIKLDVDEECSNNLQADDGWRNEDESLDGNCF